MAITPEEKQKWHNQGEKDIVEGNIFSDGPWPRILEESKDYNTRREQYEKGKEEGYKKLNK